MADARTEKQKVKEITDRLEEGLKELFESEKYKNYLSTMSKFHNYSANNIQLIAMQRPDATFVAGYKAWQKNFERHVNKGEKGIRILAPAPYKMEKGISFHDFFSFLSCGTVTKNYATCSWIFSSRTDKFFIVVIFF